MTVKVAINGFGRIGRNILRAIVESGRKDIEVVAINDLGPVETNAHLLRFDSVHGRFPAEVKVDGEFHRRQRPDDQGHGDQGPGRRCRTRSSASTSRMECTGIFTSKEKASAHLTAGAKRVIVSAPADGADLTVVYGVNHDKLTKDHIVISNASCTTNCLAPGREGPARRGRHREGLHDDDPFLHQRPAVARPDAQGPLPRPRGGAVDDPDLDRRRQGGRPRPARAQRQARRHRRSACRPRTSRWSTSSSSPRSATTKDEINEAIKRAAERPAQGHPRLHRRSRTSRSTSTTTRIRRSSTSTRPR